jgi:serine/threonine-protein kinase
VGDIFRSSPAVANGVVYAGNLDHNVYAWDAATGEQLWFYRTGDMIRTSPAIVDGMLYIGSQDYHIYAFGLP